MKHWLNLNAREWALVAFWERSLILIKQMLPAFVLPRRQIQAIAF